MATLFIPETGRYNGVAIDRRVGSRHVNVWAWKGDEAVIPTERIEVMKLMRILIHDNNLLKEIEAYIDKEAASVG